MGKHVNRSVGCGDYRYPHPTKPGVLVSRQRLWQLSRRAEGRCPRCGSHDVSKGLSFNGERFTNCRRCCVVDAARRRKS